MKSNTAILTFVREFPGKFSTDPTEADLVTNFVLLDQLITTFFKIGPTGQPEPYGAKRLSISKNHLEWTITIRDDIFDEKQKKLTPSYWCKGIESFVKRLPAPSRMILLSKLKGWDEYLKGDTPFPVICNDSEMSLTFSFSAKPEGFKEFMTMPVLGFWSTEKKFLSTGSFKLKKISGREAQLVRNGQAPNNQFDEVLIRMKGIEETQKGNVAKYEIISPVEPIQEIKSQSKLIKSTPTQLVFAELNNTNKSSLQSNDLRRELFARINAYKLKEKPATDETTPTTSVFFDSQYDNPTETSYDQSKKIKKLKVLIAGSGITAPNSYVQLIIKDVLENFSEIVEVTFSGVSKSAWDRILDRDYDVRIAAVEAGTQADKWVAEMMFCTEQGISFIDPENEFCSYLRLNPKASPSDIGNTLNNLLAKHKTLIPLFNKSSIFYVGNGIDESTLSANSPLIRFDTLKSL